jgi:hypothetical protein
MAPTSVAERDRSVGVTVGGGGGEGVGVEREEEVVGADGVVVVEGRVGGEEVSGAICEKGDEEKEEEDDGTAATEELLVLSMGSVLDDVGTGC